MASQSPFDGLKKRNHVVHICSAIHKFFNLLAGSKQQVVPLLPAETVSQHPEKDAQFTEVLCRKPLLAFISVSAFLVGCCL